MNKLLLVEDDVTFSAILENFLTAQDYLVDKSYKLKDALRSFQQHHYDLLLLDYRLPDGTGIDFLETARKIDPDIPVVIMTSFHDIRTAVKAMKSGAFDYITKPVIPEELLMVIQSALAAREKGPELLGKGDTDTSFVMGKSDNALQLQGFINVIAPTDMSIIIQGESGTGKEFVARNIHKMSKRVQGPFVAVDCGALSQELAASELFGYVKGAFTGALHNKAGLFETASGGTFFMDEIGNLSYEVQVKLLRVLQEKVIQPLGSNKVVKIDVRIIVATNDDLGESVKQGKFREDLYHRLNEFKIQVSPLRERQEDLEIFVDHFISEANKELGKNVKAFSDEAMGIFKRYDWPGNFRELKNIIKRAVLLTNKEVIDKTVLPHDMILAIYQPAQATRNESNLKVVQEQTERELIVRTLQEVKYNKSKAAKLLNIDRKTLYIKLARYGIDL